MATITSAASGNFGDTSTWVGGVLPGAVDIAVAANGHTVQLNIDSVVTEYQQLGTGKFQLGSGRTISGLVRGVANTTAGTLEFVGTGTSTINGDINGGTSVNAFAILHNSTGTLNINGNIVTNASRSGGAILMPSNGVLNINNSNISAGTGNASHALGINGTNATVTISGNSNITAPNSVGSPYAIVVNGTNATLTINTTGTITGASLLTGVETIRNAGTNSVVTITGTCVGSLGPAVNNASTGSVYVTGSVTAGTSPAILNSSTGLLSVVGTLQASSAASAVSGSTGTILLTGPFLFHAPSGRHAVNSNNWRWASSVSNSTYYQVGTRNLSSSINLVTADNITGMPAASDVKSGIAYGPSNELTGTFSQTVSPSSADIATAVWGAATRTLTTSSGPTAVQIRQEMDSNSTKLANLDATVSSRLAPSGTLATVTTLTNAPTVPSAASIRAEIDSNSTQLAAIKAKTNLLPNSPAATGDIPTETEIAAEVWAKPTTELTITGSIGERAKNQSTVSTTGAQLAAALS